MQLIDILKRVFSVKLHPMDGWLSVLLRLTGCVCTSSFQPGITVRTTNVTMLHYGQAACTLLFTAAGSAKVEVNDQQIQTEIVETEHKSVQVGSMTKQQGACATVC